MQETGPTYHASTPSEGTRSIVPVSRSARPPASARGQGRKPKSIGFFGVSFVIVSFGITIGAATIGMHELLDRRNARSAAAAAHVPPPPAASTLPAPTSSAGPDVPEVAAPAQATPADPLSAAKAKRALHQRRFGPPRSPGDSARHPQVVPPPNPYDDALE